MPDFSSTFLGWNCAPGSRVAPFCCWWHMAHLALSWWTRRRERTHKDNPLSPGESAQVRFWIARGLSDAVPPIAFMLWLHGLFFAVTTLVADFPQKACGSIEAWWHSGGCVAWAPC